MTKLLTLTVSILIFIVIKKLSWQQIIVCLMHSTLFKYDTEIFADSVEVIPNCTNGKFYEVMMICRIFCLWNLSVG